MLQPCGELRGHSDSINSLDASSDGASLGLASASDDGAVRLWDLASGRSTRAMMLPEGAAAQSVVLGRGEGPAAHCAFAASDRTVCAYDLRAPGIVLRQPAQRVGDAHDEVGQLALSEDGAFLAAADDAGTVHVFDLAAGRPPVVLHGHDTICASVAFRPRRDLPPDGLGLQLCSGGMDARCIHWDASTGRPVSEWALTPAEGGGGGQPGGGGGGGEGHEAGADYVAPTSFNPRFVHGLSYSPDGRAVAVALGDGSLELRDADTGGLLASRAAHRAAASQALFTTLREPGAPLDGADRLVLLTAGDDRRLRLWAAEGLGAPRAAAADADAASTDGAAGKRRKGGPGGRAVTTARGGGGGGGGSGRRGASGGGPFVGLSPLGETDLPDKPNWVAQVGSAVCVADSSSVVRLYRVPQ